MSGGQASISTWTQTYKLKSCKPCQINQKSLQEAPVYTPLGLEIIHFGLSYNIALNNNYSGATRVFGIYTLASI